MNLLLLGELSFQLVTPFAWSLNLLLPLFLLYFCYAFLSFKPMDKFVAEISEISGSSGNNTPIYLFPLKGLYQKPTESVIPSSKPGISSVSLQSPYLLDFPGKS